MYLFDGLEPEASGESLDVVTGSPPSHGLWEGLKDTPCPTEPGILNILLEESDFPKPCPGEIHDIQAVGNNGQA